MADVHYRNPQKTLKQYWQETVTVRLAIYLFAVIFLAQAIWIYPAYRQFEAIQIKNLSYTGLSIMQAMRTVLATELPTEEIKALAETLHRTTPLKGVRIYDTTGDLVMTFGEAPMYEPYQLHQEWNHWATPRLQEGTRVEMAWLPEDNFSQNLIVARMDSTAVTHALNEFLHNLLHMVFGVTFASTLILLFLLRRPTVRKWWHDLDLPSRSPLYKKS